VLTLTLLIACSKDALPPPPVSDTGGAADGDGGSGDEGGDDGGDTAGGDGGDDTASGAGDGGEISDTADTGALDCAEQPGVTWDSWAGGFFSTWCRSCHSSTTSERNGAPEGMDFDDEAMVATWASSIESAVLDRQSMPLGGGLYPDDLELLEVYLTCGLGKDGAAPASEWDVPAPSWGADEVAARIQAVVDRGVPEPLTVLETYIDLYDEGGDGLCPFENPSAPYELPGAFDGCDSEYGWHYEGISFYTVEERTDGYDMTFEGDLVIVDPTGDEFLGGGSLAYTVDVAGADQEDWSAEIIGTWVWPRADGWFGALESVGLYLSGTTRGSDYAATLVGGVTSEGDSVYFQDLVFDAGCGSQPAGEVRLRDAGSSYWYTVALPGDCGGCGEVVYAGSTSLGEVCLDLAAAGADLAGAMAHSRIAAR
jgi:hypothetical protein